MPSPFATRPCAPFPAARCISPARRRFASLICTSASPTVSPGAAADFSPYEARETLARLEADILATDARQVICLGDSFDDLASQDSLGEAERLWLARLQAGRRWIWIEGNHDPGPVELGGSHLAELHLAGLIFRHIAVAGAIGEVSGHYHPKHRLGGTARAAFLYDRSRLILPAYGTYTGGLSSTDPIFAELLKRPAIAVLTGTRAIPTPV